MSAWLFAALSFTCLLYFMLLLSPCKVFPITTPKPPN